MDFIPHFREIQIIFLLHLYAMFEIWRSIHVPCFHIRQMLEQGKPLQSWNAIDQSNAIHISMKLPYNRDFWQNGREIRPFFIKIL